MICSGGSRGGLREFATFENAEKEKKREGKEEKKSEFKSAKKYSTGECFGGICTYEWNALKCHMLIFGIFFMNGCNWSTIFDVHWCTISNNNCINRITGHEITYPKNCDFLLIYENWKV